MCGKVHRSDQAEGPKLVQPSRRFTVVFGEGNNCRLADDNITSAPCAATVGLLLAGSRLTWAVRSRPEAARCLLRVLPHEVIELHPGQLRALDSS